MTDELKKPHNLSYRRMAFVYSIHSVSDLRHSHGNTRTKLQTTPSWETHAPADIQLKKPLLLMASLRYLLLLNNHLQIA
jgi:hypothetical protein